MYLKIIQQLKTSDDVYQIQDEIDLLLKSMYQSTDIYNNVINNDIRNWVSTLISEETTKEGINIEEYINGLKEKIKSLKTLSLVIAFEPTRRTIENISSWIKQNLGDGIVINFMYDPKIIGGAVISFKGKYIDLSLKNVFDKAFGELRILTTDKTSADATN